MTKKYTCNICGYHPQSSASWCGAGCGRDYNKMTEIYEAPDYTGVWHCGHMIEAVSDGPYRTPICEVCNITLTEQELKTIALGSTL